ncbi:hypothetical protein T4D_9061 [Trichinella pseudospiralis]|uniref:Uncharacterized protein n=1 Tax=Trichinella pseudospiralis TaxID=6337 RepID=A0A0V1F6S1_TRIPS|nr:hypothetical protein T4D_9061 [Trichinella pseudospiralis]
MSLLSVSISGFIADSDYSEYFSDMGLIPEVILVDQKVLRIDVQPLCDCERYRKFWELEEIDIVYQLEIESPAEGSTIIRRDLPFFHDIENHRTEYPEAAHEMLMNMHVDDILLSRVDKSGAQKMITELMELLKIGSFELLKWSSNYVDVVFSRDSLLNTKGSVPYDPDFLAPFHFLIRKGYRNIHEISDDDDNDPSVLNPNRQRTEHTVEINTTWLVANLWKRWKN